MSGPNDWLTFYNQNFPTQDLTQSIPNSTTTAATVAATTTTVSPPLGMMMSSSSPSASSQHLSPEGRVSKPTRRRSRASRRTPTTLLNTDTTNFRAMVQQFTGGPSAPFAPTASPASSSLPNLLGFGFGPRSGVPPVNTSTLMVSPPAGYNLLQQQQQQQQHLFQQQNQPHMYSSGNTQGGGGDNTFFQRLSNPTRPPVDHDEILMDHGHGGRFFPSTSSS